ncbi:hypothetical protein MUP77_00835, partial [Candidatus Bathyarchaeota archaeon]|nr:hypothetical protein [Candidatus Bathyarchaeota archaeon]
TRFVLGRRAQVFPLAVFLLVILLLTTIGVELVSRSNVSPPIQGQPTKDPNSGLYTVYLIVNGHRDSTFFHTNFHANIHIDFIFYYFTTPPDPPSGHSFTDFSKPIHVTVTITNPSIVSPLLNTFDVSVSMGAKWGVVLTYTLPSGTYILDAQGVDQDGFKSSSNAQLILP